MPVHVIVWIAVKFGMSVVLEMVKICLVKFPISNTTRVVYLSQIFTAIPT